MANTISVIIPCYNRSKVIESTLQCILNQSRTPDEVIVVDDGSTDDSVNVIKKYASNIKLIRQPNRGPGAARNLGLSASHGDYIWFMDSDDLASANQLEAQYHALENSGCDLAYGSWVRTKIDKPSIKFVGPVLQSKALPSSRSMLEWQLGSWSIVFQACLFRRTALAKAGLYRTDMCIAEDMEYLIRILLIGASPIFVGGTLLFYRSEGNDQLSQPNRHAKRNALDITRYYEQIGDLLGDKLFLLDPGVKNELAIEVYRHQRYCKTIGIRGINQNNLVLRLLDDNNSWLIRFFDVCDRVHRRVRYLHPAVPASPGMMARDPCLQDKDLVPRGFNASFD